MAGRPSPSFLRPSADFHELLRARGEDVIDVAQLCCRSSVMPAFSTSVTGGANDRHSGCGVRPRRGFYSTEIIKEKCPKGIKVSKINRGIWCPRRATRIVKEGQCSGRKGPGKGRSPVAARAPHLGPGARGRRLPFSGFVLLWARGASRCTARHPGPSAVSRVRSSYSTLPSWTHEDTSVHARGKRPVSRGEAQPAYNSGGDEAPFPSGVPHHTPPALAV